MHKHSLEVYKAIMHLKVFLCKQTISPQGGRPSVNDIHVSGQDFPSQPCMVASYYPLYHYY